MSGRLDWKWIGIGVVIMVVLNLVAGLVLGLVLGSELEGVTSPEDVQLSGGQVVLAAVLNFLAFAIGGYIVGLKSAGRTILEPGISAAIAVLIALLIAGNFSVVNIIAGGIVPFLAGVLGRLARRAPAGDGLAGRIRQAPRPPAPRRASRRWSERRRFVLLDGGIGRHQVSAARPW